MEPIINRLTKDPLYLILTIFAVISSIMLIFLYIIEKKIESIPPRLIESELSCFKNDENQ